MRLDLFVVEIYVGQYGYLFGSPGISIGFFHLVYVAFSFLLVPVIAIAAGVFFKMRGSSESTTRFDD